MLHYNCIFINYKIRIDIVNKYCKQRCKQIHYTLITGTKFIVGKVYNLPE